MNTYVITEDLIAEIYVNGVLVDWPGPWTDHAAAETWAIGMIAALDAGDYTYQQGEP